MNKESHIRELLKKFRQGDLSPLEARELALYVKEGDRNESLHGILNDLWQNTTDDDITAPSARMLSILQQNLGETIKIQPSPQRKTVAFNFRVILRYAAIVVFSAGLTWFAKDVVDNRSRHAFSADAKNGSNNEITVSYGSKSKVVLPDGSIVNLNSGSTLRYPARFDRFSRNVFIEGEAFFDIKKDPKHPFYVKTNDITIKVLGTKFNVKSYPDEKIIQTTLVTGSIEIYSNKKDISERNRLLTLMPNQQVTIKKEEKAITEPRKQYALQNMELKSIITLPVSPQVDLAPIIDWKDNRLVFRDDTFSDLVRKMERWYDVEIVIKDKELSNAVLSGVFVKESVEQALQALRLATPFQYQIEKNQIIISK